MNVLGDPHGRPIDRLYFKTEELEDRCERKIADFTAVSGAAFGFPFPPTTLSG
jgi:hypothetical protein